MTSKINAKWVSKSSSNYSGSWSSWQHDFISRLSLTSRGLKTKRKISALSCNSEWFCLITKKWQHNFHLEFAEKKICWFLNFFHWKKKSFLYASGTTRNLLFFSSVLSWYSLQYFACLTRAVIRQGCQLEPIEFSLSSDTGYAPPLAALRSNMLFHSFHSGFGCGRQLVRKWILSLMSV